ncbi:MAG: tetratricopeptide repeat protein, partial [Lentisphaerae bacterium]|nr:tetratricopeptide repeat protein [Lentisphaerota bacterium]
MVKVANKIQTLFGGISLFFLFSFICLFQVSAQVDNADKNEVDLEAIQKLESKLKSDEEAVSGGLPELSAEEYLARASKSYAEGITALTAAEKALDAKNLQEASSQCQAADKHFANVNAMIFRFLGKAREAEKTEGEKLIRQVSSVSGRIRAVRGAVLAAQEKARRSELVTIAENTCREADAAIEDATKLVFQASRKFSAGNLEEAHKLYIDVKNKAREAAGMVAKLAEGQNERARDVLRKCENYRVHACIEIAKIYRMQAETNLGGVGPAKIDDAIGELSSARVTEFGDLPRDPDLLDRIDRDIKNLQTLRSELEFKNETSIQAVIPDIAERDYKIKVKLEEGRIFLDNRRYAQARECFEQVLLEDPFELTAIRNLARINEELKKVADAKLETMLKERLAEVRWRWSEPVTPLMSGAVDGFDTRTIRRTDDSQGINKKLDNIILPKIIFDNDTLKDVLNEILPRKIKEA